MYVYRIVDIRLLGTTSADALVLTVRPIVRIYATHGVSGVEWSHYPHPLPEYVYNVFMQYWKDVMLIPNNLQFK